MTGCECATAMANLQAHDCLQEPPGGARAFVLSLLLWQVGASQLKATASDVQVAKTRARLSYRSPVDLKRAELARCAVPLGKVRKLGKSKLFLVL